MKPSATSASLKSKLTALLESLYGEMIGDQTFRNVGALVARYDATIKTLPGGGALSERDALLISYADQVCEEGIAPQSLRG